MERNDVAHDAVRPAAGDSADVRIGGRVSLPRDDVASRAERASWIIIATITALAIATVGWLGTYSRYVADDWGFELLRREHGFWRGQLEWYSEWSGRFAANFVSILLAPLGVRSAVILPGVLLLAWAVAAAFAARALLGRQPWWVSASVGLFFVYACVDAAPHPYQSFLWQTGAVTYLLPLVLVTAIVPLVLSPVSSRVRGALAVLIALVAAGCSEMMAASAVLAASIAAFAVKPLLRRRVVAVAAASLVALVIIAAAPGNAKRQEHFSPPESIVEEVVTTADLSLFYFLDFLLRGGIPALLLFAVAAAAAVNKEPASTNALAAAGAIAVLTIVATHLVPVHVGYGGPPLRALVIPDFFFFGAVAITGMAVGPRVRNPQPFALVVVTVLVIVAPIVSITTNVRQFAATRAFAKEWDAMAMVMRGAAGRDVLVDAPRQVGGLEFLSRNPEAGINRTVAAYYGAKSVATSRGMVGPRGD